MSGDIKRAGQYRAQAAALLQMSERVIDVTQKSTWVEMASIYKRLAEQLEEMHRLGDKPSSD